MKTKEEVKLYEKVGLKSIDEVIQEVNRLRKIEQEHELINKLYQECLSRLSFLESQRR